jgi:adenylyl-sulfate kinase
VTTTPTNSHGQPPPRADETTTAFGAGRVIWLTGLSGAGKSTVARGLRDALAARRRPVYLLDGDEVRRGLCSDLGFSAADRRENIRRVGEVARLSADAGVFCVVAFISPYRADRDRVRSILPPGRFIEVFVDTPLAVCEARDPKGLYAKARAGLLADFTGISAPYEPPSEPEVTLPCGRVSASEAVDLILRHLEQPESSPVNAAGRR